MRRRAMPQAILPFFFLLPFFSQVPFLPVALPALPDPDPAPIQPSVVLPTAASSSTSPPAATIPAFPEQSDVAAEACPLDHPADLLPSLRGSCPIASGDNSGDHTFISRSRCCPVLAAFLYAAYAPTALAVRPLPSAGTGEELPVLPEDSEACAAGAERELRARGVALPRLNGTCDAAACYCGVRLRRLACAGGFAASGRRWAPAGGAGRRLERDCARPGLAGCTRCLRTLNQLKAEEEEAGGNVTSAGRKEGYGRECQLMGVTWLLLQNRTLYFPVAAGVLRALMGADASGASADPTSCALPRDEMPFAVDSAQINDHDGSSTALRWPSAPLRILLSLLLVTLI